MTRRTETALLIIAAALAGWLLLMRTHATPQTSASPPSLDAWTRFLQTVPPMGRADFGSHIRTFTFTIQHDSIIQDAYSRPDGSMLVALDKNDPPGSMTDVYSLWSLDRGRLRPVGLPHLKPPTYYTSINLECGQVRADPIICASDDDGHEWRFIASENDVTRTDLPAKADVNPFTLKSGDVCIAETDEHSPTAIWAVSSTGKRRALVSRRALSAASRGYQLDPSHLDVRCGYIAGVDLLSITNTVHDGPLYEFAGSTLVLVTRGEILAGGARHALVDREDISSRSVDYLEIFNR